jgi:hypothetical protein
MSGRTVVSIEGSDFLIQGARTYARRTFRGHRIEGLLLNSRMVQATFDDLNPATRMRWDTPEGPWDAERNTQAFLRAMPEWRSAGLLAVTVNFQGGSPQGYSREQPWVNSAFDFRTGALRADYAGRMGRVIERADELGMVVILGLFYFGQEPRFESEDAIRAATDAATDWVLQAGFTNVLIEVANECDILYRHGIIGPGRADELIGRIRSRSAGRVASPAGRLLVSTSLRGGAVPNDVIHRSADFLLIHGNGVGGPEEIRSMVRRVRSDREYRGVPIVFNEDDHFDFDRADNHFIAAISEGASWGYFDYRMPGEGFEQGYQSVPVDWSTSSERKRGFFRLLAEVTGSSPRGGDGRR